MKTIIISAAAIITIGATMGDVSAAEFAPWNEARIESRADSVQTDVVVGPFYRNAAPTRVDAPSTRQADVDIAPWYAKDRV